MARQFQHSVTQEYLRAWAHPPRFKGVPGFHRHPNGTITPKSHISIRRTGGEFNLYGFTNLGPKGHEHMETEFLTPQVDNPGHAVLTKIRQRDSKDISLTDQERWDFAVYLNSLNLRTPKSVKRVRDMGPQILQAELERDPERYRSMWKPGYPETAEGFLNWVWPAMKENFGLMGLPAAILNENLVEPIYKMAWSVLDLSGAGISLLTSDNPMWASDQPGDPSCLLALPLSPTSLFMATRSESLSLIQSEQRERIAELSNRSQCQGAVRFVYGEAPLEFVREFMVSVAA